MIQLQQSLAISGEWGPGDDGCRPLHGKYWRARNAYSVAIGAPNGSAGEKHSTYFAWNGKFGIDTWYGNYVYVVSGQTRLYIGVVTTSPACYSASPPAAPTPGACPSGWTEQATVLSQNGNPNIYCGNSTVNSTTTASAQWTGYQQVGYGCPDGFIINFRVRRCYVVL
jgi:hypothetical protein